MKISEVRKELRSLKPLPWFRDRDDPKTVLLYWLGVAEANQAEPESVEAFVDWAQDREEGMIDSVTDYIPEEWYPDSEGGAA